MNQLKAIWRNFFVGIMFLSFLCFFVFVESFSINADVTGAPSAESVRQKENEKFLMTIDIDPTIKIPICFVEIKIFELDSRRPICAQAYIHNIADSFWEEAAGFFTDEELAVLSDGNALIELNNTMALKESCICILFSELPPRESPVEIFISYRLFGLFSKSENFIYHWE